MAKVLGDESLSRAASDLAQRCTREKLENWESDVLYGKAGTIMGLLVLSDLLEQPGLVGACERIARKLLRAADKSTWGYSWSASAMPSSRNLTGFSHGTAGIGCALLELFHATGDLKYQKAAEAAFSYENHWYDSEMQNWPDLREGPSRAKAKSACISICHFLVPRSTGNRALPSACVRGSQRCQIPGRGSRRTCHHSEGCRFRTTVRECRLLPLPRPRRKCRGASLRA